MNCRMNAHSRQRSRKTKLCETEKGEYCISIIEDPLEGMHATFEDLIG